MGAEDLFFAERANDAEDELLDELDELEADAVEMELMDCGMPVCVPMAQPQAQATSLVDTNTDAELDELALLMDCGSVAPIQPKPIVVPSLPVAYDPPVEEIKQKNIRKKTV